MLGNQTRVLLIVSQDLLDEARMVAGRMTALLKLPVSLQIVFRALLEVGLGRENRAAFVARVETQAKAMHERRRSGSRARGAGTRRE